MTALWKPALKKEPMSLFTIWFYINSTRNQWDDDEHGVYCLNLILEIKVSNSSE